MHAQERLFCDGYRVWVLKYNDWQPMSWSEVPPRGVVLEPAEPGCLSENEAAVFVETFNQSMLHQRRKLWAVSVPVAIRYLGDLRPGQVLQARRPA